MTCLIRRYKKKEIEKFRPRFDNVFDLDNDCVNRLIIPIIHAMHFFVLVVDFNQTCPDFFVNIDYYDSLQYSTKAGAAACDPTTGSFSSELLSEVKEFLCNFVLHRPEHKHLQRPHSEVLDKLTYWDCPMQNNVVDCGLFMKQQV